jgi:hypothetical protein
MRRTTRALDLSGLPTMAITVDEQRQVLTELLREHAELLRASATIAPPRSARRR